MELTQKERQGRGLDALGGALAALVDTRMQDAVPGRAWLPMYEAKEAQRLGRPYRADLDDPRLMLRILRYERGIFTEIDATQRAWIDELVQASNRAAHSTTLDPWQVDRALDTMTLLARSLGLDEVLVELVELRVLGSTESTATEAAVEEDDAAEPDFDVTPVPRAEASTRVTVERLPAREAPPGAVVLSMVAGTLDVEVLLYESLNYALVHNGVSPVIRLRVHNRSEDVARDVTVTAEDPVDPRWVARRLADRYAATWTFVVDGLVGATPELLVRSQKGLVTSRVLAGTIRRTGNDEADMARAGILAHSSKDLEEHEYAVASVAAALSPFCSSTNVPDVPFVLPLPNVLHLASDVTGVLAPDEPRPTSLALAAALHPSAAVCGTPTAAARDVIRAVEHMDRDRYAGPVGWLGADGDGEWGIGLRSGRVSADDPRRVRIFAGCGVVAASEPTAELAESEAKLEPMRWALGVRTR